MDGIDNDDDDEDEWDTYLNWSTEDNPDGVGIVHDAMDQVSCFCLREKERDFCFAILNGCIPYFHTHPFRDFGELI